jgi:hypothetical protein
MFILFCLFHISLCFISKKKIKKNQIATHSFVSHIINTSSKNMRIFLSISRLVQLLVLTSSLRKKKSQKDPQNVYHFYPSFLALYPRNSTINKTLISEPNKELETKKRRCRDQQQQHHFLPFSNFQTSKFHLKFKI